MMTNERQHFPYKLYDMLEYAANSEHSSAVSWVEEGRAFAIHDKESFLQHLVPMFFKQTKFRSFTRQLNMWGFKRFSSDGSDMGTWGHEEFVRGRADRLRYIERVVASGSPKYEANRERVVQIDKTIAEPPLVPTGGLPPTYYATPSVPSSPLSVPPSIATQPLTSGSMIPFQHGMAAATQQHSCSPFSRSLTMNAQRTLARRVTNPLPDEGTNEDEILLLLSVLFDSGERSNCHDRSSVMYETSEDFSLDPIPF